jgi:chemotaxis regulatin CheY-phosphate phosphatase CheZ
VRNHLGRRRRHRRQNQGTGHQEQVEKNFPRHGKIFEACSFQDLTGQRLGKITRTVSSIEDGVREISILAGGKNVANGKGRKKVWG